MYISVILYYLDTIKHKLVLGDALGFPPFLSAALSLFTVIYLIQLLRCLILLHARVQKNRERGNGLLMKFSDCKKHFGMIGW